MSIIYVYVAAFTHFVTEALMIVLMIVTYEAFEAAVDSFFLTTHCVILIASVT